MINSAFFSFLVRRAITACCSRFCLTRGLTITLGPRFLGMRASNSPCFRAWVRQVRFAQPAQEATLLDYLHEVKHLGERVKRLEQAITEVVKRTSPQV